MDSQKYGGYCSPKTFNNRGLTKVKMEDLAGARADFKRALELEPGMREARENLKGLAGLEQKPSDSLDQPFGLFDQRIAMVR